MSTMDPDLQRLADRIARSLWGSVRRAQESTVDLDDLHQESSVAAWRWAQTHPAWNADEHSRNTARKAVRWDVVDVLRSRGGRAGSARWRASTASLDALLSVDESDAAHGSIGTVLSDETAPAAFEEVERQHDLRHAFSEYQGNPRHAAAAWLVLRGYTLKAIGDHFGVTEARAWQYRNAFITKVRQEWAGVDRDT